MNKKLNHLFHFIVEESQRRLGIIVDKIDKDNDGFITFEEMRNWIRFTQVRLLKLNTCFHEEISGFVLL
jgi:hypothetical protein